MSLELKNVTKQVQGITHIKDTSLTLQPGQFNVLLGETGAGKTSLIKLMAGLDSLASGQIILNGKDVSKLSAQKRNISLVHQFFVNYPHMSVYDNIASPLKVAGVAKSEIQGRVEEAADLLRLKPYLNRKPHELSGGQQQRTALARAIVKTSDAVFLDEPLANLDYKLREELRDQLPDLFAGRGAVVVYATSEPEEALLLGGKTALMTDGNVVQFGPTSEIYRKPKDLDAAKGVFKSADQHRFRSPNRVTWSCLRRVSAGRHRRVSPASRTVPTRWRSGQIMSCRWKHPRIRSAWKATSRSRN